MGNYEGESLLGVASFITFEIFIILRMVVRNILLTEYVEIVPSFKDYKLYESKGYTIPKYWDKEHYRFLTKRGTKIKVRVSDLPKGSHAKVEVACDYCGKIKEIAYRDYLKNHDEELGDCCVKCRPIKYEHTMLEKYGVKNSSLMPDTKAKIIATNREKYGCDWQMQSPLVQEKSRKTMLERYGYEHALQVDEFLDKCMSTKYENGINPTSKPQKALSNLLLEMYGNCELERPCGRYSLDCAVRINNILIDVEYDGLYWHQDKERDERRNVFVQNQGYKVLRVKGNKKDELPTKERIDEQIQKLLHGEKYAEIQM